MNSSREMSWEHSISKLPFSNIPRISKARLHAKKKCAETYKQKKTRAPERGRAELEEGGGGETSALNCIF